MRLVHHREYPTLTAARSVYGDLLQIESLERSPNNVLSDVARGGILGEVVEHTLGQPRWQIFWHVVSVVGVGT